MNYIFEIQKVFNCKSKRDGLAKGAYSNSCSYLFWIVKADDCRYFQVIPEIVLCFDISNSSSSTITPVLRLSLPTY